MFYLNILQIRKYININLTVSKLTLKQIYVNLIISNTKILRQTFINFIANNIIIYQKYINFIVIYTKNKKMINISCITSHVIEKSN